MSEEKYRRRNMNAGAMLGIILLLFFGLMILKGCASMKCEPYGDTIWASGAHAEFSTIGFKDCETAKAMSDSRMATPIDDLVYPEITKEYLEAADKCQQAIQKSINEGWWGCPVEGVP
ncbi:MAG: hypothetical protein PHN75_18645 [Syntrophales bacterium]|nr:hypothetical protein [Syntrophales bacterium]